MPSADEAGATMNRHHAPADPRTRLLIVDDIAGAREQLLYLLASDQQLEVVAAVGAGEALEAVLRHRPDVAVVDLHAQSLPMMRHIMESAPLPIVALAPSAGVAPGEAAAALQAGAVAVVKRPGPVEGTGYAEAAREMFQTLRLMAEVRTVRRWPVRLAPNPPRPEKNPHARVELVAIGASTGGPVALQRILGGLPANFPVPVVIVQHMTEGFTGGFCQWLGETSGFPVETAQDGKPLKPGRAYVAPYGRQLSVNVQGRTVLVDAPAENGHLPSVSWLFRSVLQAYGARAAAVLLTGMGRDGAVELAELKRQGAVTLIQDRESSVVYGMPGAARALGAACHEMAPQEIAAALEKLVRR